jgi:hypothetical protein
MTNEQLSVLLQLMQRCLDNETEHLEEQLLARDIPEHDVETLLSGFADLDVIIERSIFGLHS